MTIATPERGAVTVTPDDDAFWATAGGMGLTGVVTEATLALQPVETAYITVDTERADDVDDCMARMLDGDDRYRYSVAWIDCLASGKHLGRSVLTRGNHTRLDAMPDARRAGAREFSPRVLLHAPPWLPNGLLNPLSTRAFNELWFRKAPRQRENQIQSITGFFHPLDAVQGWNRIYGTHGFVQYQFVVPYGAEAVVHTALERLSAQRCASFLAVLKRFEHESRGMLGFPIRGWTLALDVPARGNGLWPLLDGLDELVAEAGGRVYLTKDARLRAEMLPAMYPQLERWREVRAGLDPRHAMASDLDRRLQLS
jgi:decaprenylphospho-beta-D-ribofuranose 2-oxidase